MISASAAAAAAGSAAPIPSDDDLLRDFHLLDTDVNPEALPIDQRPQDCLILKKSVAILREVAALFESVNKIQSGQCLGSDEKFTQFWFFEPWSYSIPNAWSHNYDKALHGLAYLARLKNRTLYVLDHPLSRFDFSWNYGQRKETLGKLLDTVTKTCTVVLPQLDATLATCTIPNKQAVQQRIRTEQASLNNQVIPRIRRLLEAHQSALHAPQPNVERVGDAQFHRLDLLVKSLLYPQDRFVPQEHYIELPLVVIQADVAKAWLKERFGESLVADVFKFYQIGDHLQLSPQDIQALLVGIMANINLEDLETIHRLKHTLLLPKLGALADIPFHRMTQLELCRLLAAIRNIDMGGAACPERDRNYALQLQADCDFLDVCSRSFIHYDPHLNHETTYTRPIRQKFGWTEYLARDIVYALCYTSPRRFREGVLFPMHDESGEIVCKQARSFMFEVRPDGQSYTDNLIPGEKGLYAIGILPALRKDERLERGSLQIAFRGSFDSDSWVRNLAPTHRRRSYLRIPVERWQGATEGPGGLLFQSRKEMMLQGIQRLLNGLKPVCQTVSIDFLGHSLAATDDMRACEMMSEALAKSPDAQVQALNLYAYNPPGFEWDLAWNFINNMETASRQSPRLRSHLRYFKTEGDIVQFLPGQALCGYRWNDQAMPDCLKISVIKFEPMLNSSSGSSSLMLVKENGSVEGTQKYLEKKLNAHTAHTMNGIRDGNPDEPNIFYVPYILTNDREGDALLRCVEKAKLLSPDHQVNKEDYFRPAGVIIDLDLFNEMLRPQFHLTSYLKSKDMSLEAFLQKYFRR